MKFHEWGTTMHKPKHFMLDAARPTYQALKEIAEEEYEKTLKEKLGNKHGTFERKRKKNSLIEFWRNTPTVKTWT